MAAEQPVPAADGPMSERERRILELVFDISPRRERLHERDCAACDIAAEVAGGLAAVWDPHMNWAETEVADGLPGDTLLDQAHRVAAHVLHRRMPGYRRPSDAAIIEDLREDFERTRRLRHG